MAFPVQIESYERGLMRLDRGGMTGTALVAIDARNRYVCSVQHMTAVDPAMSSDRVTSCSCPAVSLNLSGLPTKGFWNPPRSTAW